MVGGTKPGRIGAITAKDRKLRLIVAVDRSFGSLEARRAATGEARLRGWPQPYGSTRTAPVGVGGQITGVDESPTVQLRAIDWPVLGCVSGIPAGGQNTPWSVRVGFTAPPAPC